jgi:hypothetical protein
MSTLTHGLGEDYTTNAIGEEDGPITNLIGEDPTEPTHGLGEDFTTNAIGEEGGDPIDPNAVSSNPFGGF